MALTWLFTTAAVLTTLLAAPAAAIHECNSVFIHDVFRCNSDKRLCLATKDLVCREPMLSTGIYGMKVETTLPLKKGGQNSPVYSGLPATILCH